MNPPAKAGIRVERIPLEIGPGHSKVHGGNGGKRPNRMNATAAPKTRRQWKGSQVRTSPSALLLTHAARR